MFNDNIDGSTAKTKSNGCIQEGNEWPSVESGGNGPCGTGRGKRGAGVIYKISY